VSKFHSGRFTGTRGDSDDGFRTVNGFTTKVHEGRQGKHIIGHNNYAVGKSVLHMTMSQVQNLVEKFAGSGEWHKPNKETINFNQAIGTWVSKDGSERLTTSRGTIHYSSKGCHIVPAQPKKGK
jgi:hypothetical protein